ncbi:MAG: cellulase family glycosylhydrolase [Chloroflexi bacterium]|nr:cellulase family glycosylhydrolase [Chloroflexota bacterium]
MLETDKFLLGVNYWPRHRAMYWWKEFDHSEVEEEFEEIRSLGAELVRIFLLWEDFQPYPDRISDKSFRNLEIVLNIAVANGLRVIPTFFTGHMSGANWIPSWALVPEEASQRRFPCISDGRVVYGGVRDLYKDPFMIEAQLLQVRFIVGYLSRHRGIFGWDLANEHDNLLIPETVEDGQRWMETFYREIKKIDPHHPVTIGLHGEDLEGDKHLYPSSVAAHNDFLSMHGYSIYVQWGKHPLDSDVVPFLCRLAQRLGGKPVLCEEFGLWTVEDGIRSAFPKGATEEQGALYYREVLEKLHRIGVLGALAWCFSDYDQSLWNKPPLDTCVHERFFGLTRRDTSLKPAARVFREFAARRLTVTTPPPFSPLDSLPYYENPLDNLMDEFGSFRA